MSSLSPRILVQPGLPLTTTASNLAGHLPQLLVPQPPYGTARRITAWVATFIGVTVPLMGLVAAIVLLWGRGFSWVDLGLMVGMYLATMIGVTVGFHRLFTHRSFATSRPIQFILGVLGSMTFQGPLIPGWAGIASTISTATSPMTPFSLPARHWLVGLVPRLLARPHRLGVRADAGRPRPLRRRPQS